MKFHKRDKKHDTFRIWLAVIAVAIALGIASDLFLGNKQFLKSIEDFIAKLIKPQEAASVLLVDDFQKGQASGVFYERKNSIGAYQGTWAKRPSYSVITKLSDEKAPQRGRYLSIEYKKEAGWAGWYTLLNDANISNYNALTFLVKGEKGGEKFDIGLADAKMQELQIDAVYLGPVDLFLPFGVTTEWQKVRMPISRVESQIDINKMGSIVLWFKYGGQGKIYIDDVRFEYNREVQRKEEYNAPMAKYEPKHPRSLWVWKIDPVDNIKGRKELFELCRRAAITNLYLYFGDFDPENETQRAEQLASFLKEAHKKGLKVEALTGTPVWSLEAYHKECLNWINAFLKFNQTRLQDMRMDGISLDVEPYLTSEWQSDREKVKSDYIELLKKVRALLDDSKQNMKLGVAISPFYTDIDDGRFEEEILKLVDYAALMDYYDDPGKIIEKGLPHLVMADRLGKKVSIGVETQDLIALNQGERRFTFFEEGWEYMEAVLNQVSKKFKAHRSFEGFAIHCYYSYKLLQRGRNVPIKQRPKDIYSVASLKRTLPLKIDGNLKDWNILEPYPIDKKVNVVYGKFAWGGPNDLSSKVYTMWDDDNLYFAFDVTDDKILQEKTGHDMWEGDHIEMWLDLDLMGDYNEAINSNDDFQFGFSPGNFRNVKPEVYIWVPELGIDYKSQIDIASRKTETGYSVEVKLPISILNAAKNKIAGIQPVKLRGLIGQPLKDKFGFHLKKDAKFGISIEPSDCDDVNAPQKVLMSSSVNRVWGDPTTFGILELK